MWHGRMPASMPAKRLLLAPFPLTSSRQRAATESVTPCPGPCLAKATSDPAPLRHTRTRRAMSAALEGFKQQFKAVSFKHKATPLSAFSGSFLLLGGLYLFEARARTRARAGARLGLRPRGLLLVALALALTPTQAVALALALALARGRLLLDGPARARRRVGAALRRLLRRSVSPELHCLWPQTSLGICRLAFVCMCACFGALWHSRRS